MWAAEDHRDIVTALSIMEEREKALARGKGTSAQRAPGAGGPQYSG